MVAIWYSVSGSRKVCAFPGNPETSKDPRAGDDISSRERKLEAPWGNGESRVHASLILSLPGWRDSVHTPASRPVC